MQRAAMDRLRSVTSSRMLDRASMRRCIGCDSSVAREHSCCMATASAFAESPLPTPGTVRSAMAGESASCTSHLAHMLQPWTKQASESTCSQAYYSTVYTASHSHAAPRNAPVLSERSLVGITSAHDDAPLLQGRQSQRVIHAVAHH